MREADDKVGIPEIRKFEKKKQHPSRGRSTQSGILEIMEKEAATVNREAGKLGVPKVPKVDVSPLYSKFVYLLSHREKHRERMVYRTTARRKEKGSGINSRTPFIESHTNRNDCDVGGSSRKP